MVDDQERYIIAEHPTSGNMKRDRYVINGTFEAAVLQDTIRRFVASHVTCNKCGNPETTYVTCLTEPRLSLDCKACGHVGTVREHKINKKIITSL